MVIYFQQHLTSSHPKSHKPYVTLIAWFLLWVSLVLVMSQH